MFNLYLDNDTSQVAGNSFQFFDADSFANFGYVNFNISGLAAGLTWSVADLGDFLQLNLLGAAGSGGGSTGGGGPTGGGGVTAVPEPGVLDMFGLGLLLLGGGLGLRKRYDEQSRSGSDH